MSIFATLKDTLSKSKLGLSESGESVVGVDIGSSAIKVVQVKEKGGKVVLETYGEIATGPYGGQVLGQAALLPPEKMAEALKDLFREANITAKRVAFAIPMRSSLLKIVEIPEFNEKQLSSIIPIEARKYIPVPVSEVELDWWVIPRQQYAEEPDVEGAEEVAKQKERGKQIEVLLVAIHKEILSRYRSVVKTLGLETKTFEVETFSTIRSLMSRDITPTAIVDIGAATSKLSIIDYGIVKVSNTINKGGQDATLALATALSVPFPEAEKMKREQGLVGTATSGTATSGVASSSFEYVFHEAQKFIADYEKRTTRIVRKMILVGGGALTKGIVPLAESVFGAEIHLGDPFAKTEAPAFLAEVLREAGPEFAPAIGLALREISE